MADNNRKLPDDKTTILVTKEQHEKLDRIREHLKEKVDADAELRYSSFQPTFADALEWTLEQAEKGFTAEKSSETNVFDMALAQAVSEVAKENIDEKN